MRRICKILIGGAFVGMLGVFAGMTPPGMYLEEHLGLSLLFQLRGIKKPPGEVLIVDMDKESAKKLNIDPKAERWPRSIHARLVDKLAREDVTVIVFDLFFDRDHPSKHDPLFSRAVKKARRVVISGSLSKEVVRLEKGSGRPRGEMKIERSLPLIPEIADSAMAAAPFPLPKRPVRVSQFWTFKQGAGDIPTLPVAAFQVHSLGFYEEFVQLLKNAAGVASTEGLPENLEAVYLTGNVLPLIEDMRAIFKNRPDIGFRILQDAEQLEKTAADARKGKILKSLVTIYRSPESRYLNYYGPPRTIATVSYHAMLQNGKPPAVDGKEIELKGKAIFVGVSERDPVQQKDSFYTVYTQPDGLDLSGVEIAATAFANLVEDAFLRRLPLSEYIAFIFLAATISAALCLVFPAFHSAVAVAGAGFLYLFYAKYRFENHAMWLPLAVPLLVQAPFAFFGAVFWKYFKAEKERKNIKKAFGFYLPDRIVEQLAKETAGIRTNAETVRGTCLCTDGEQYAAISERLSPAELRDFLNRYYEKIFQPVRERGGIVTDIIGDSMMAIWTETDPDPSARIQACKAALDIRRSVREFSRDPDSKRLPTRIGIHSGYVSLGNIGGADHLEYRPVGDAVNTASRLESLNKKLGTKILASSEVLSGIDCFLTREIGTFFLAGKSNPITIHELVCRLEDSDGTRERFHAVFSSALAAFGKQSWDVAVKLLEEALAMEPSDGPCRFYLGLCEKFEKNPPGEKWEGRIRLMEK